MIFLYYQKEIPNVIKTNGSFVVWFNVFSARLQPWRLGSKFSCCFHPEILLCWSTRNLSALTQLWLNANVVKLIPFPFEVKNQKKIDFFFSLAYAKGDEISWDAFWKFLILPAFLIMVLISCRYVWLTSIGTKIKFEKLVMHILFN